MQAAASFEKQQKYPEAIKAYQEALRLVPNDAKATASLKGAQYAGHMFEGRKAANAKRFPDAIREFEEALKLSPNNPEATGALKRAREGKP
jgi:tetratricopeptide (TPR) repeat protein